MASSFFGSAIILLVTGLLLTMLLSSNSFSRREAGWVRNAWFFNLLGLSGFLVIMMFVYGSGDMFVYYRDGVVIADLLREDLGYYFPATVLTFFHQPNVLDPLLYAAESSTGTMTSISSWGNLFLGNSLVAVCVLGGMLSFSGRLAIYLTFRREFPDLKQRKLLILTALCVPSAVFWTGGLLKETFACFGLGWTLWGLVRFFRDKKYIRGALAVMIASPFILMIKPYIMIPLGIGFGAYLLVLQARRKGRSLVGVLSPRNVFLVLLLGMGSVILVGELFPRFALDNIAEETARLQAFANSGKGASSYALGDAEARSLPQQMAYAPIALITSLFRPFFFEIHNVPAAMSGVEMLVIQFIFLRAMWRRGSRDLLARCLNTPPMAFCALFVLLLGLGVGLGTTNLGTLTRYRAPLMPFYALLLALWVTRTPQTRPARQQKKRVQRTRPHSPSRRYANN